jgi:hypothetical protein
MFDHAIRLVDLSRVTQVKLELSLMGMAAMPHGG